MGTFEHEAVIATLAERASTQVQEGLACVQRGDYIAAESWLRPALSTLDSLQALLDAEPVKPLRKLALVQVGTAAVPHDPELPDWFERKANDDDGGDSAA